MDKILAIIPARSGSKSVKDKNIRLINGRPMIAYTIEHAIKSKRINRVIVSTDSPLYAEIAKKYGAEVPFLRPSDLAKDDSLDIEVFSHALNYLQNSENYIPDIVVQLRPTYPIRNIADIDKMIDMLGKDKSADSARCIAPAKEIAYKMWRYDNMSSTISPLLNDIPEAYNMPRQQLPKIYYQNACIDVVRTNVIIKKHSMSGDKILGYKMNNNFDIDTEEDFRQAEEYLKLLEGKNTFVFDIDGVIAKFNSSLEYNLSEPDEETIKIVNLLYEMGNTIILFTARGYKTGINWKETTISQMKKWGVKYHELKIGKPDADFYIDDKSLSIDVIKKYLS